MNIDFILGVEFGMVLMLLLMGVISITLSDYLATRNKNDRL